MPARERSPDELAEDLARIESAVERGSAETRKAIEALAAESRQANHDMFAKIESTFVRQDVYDARHAIVLTRLDKVEERGTWLGRTAVTALLLPILVTIVVAVILAGGGR
jgi:hypothetical protein